MAKQCLLFLTSVLPLFTVVEAYASDAVKAPHHIDSSQIANSNLKECVILLHGLGRSKFSMLRASSYLGSRGYQTVNVDYPSTEKPIAELAKTYVPPAVKECKSKGVEKIHFLTHSLGGIIVRQFLQTNELPAGSRIVMLSPPNKGSELADSLRDFFLYKVTTGPAGQELGTRENDVPKRLEAIDAEVGIITGDDTIEPWFSMLIKGSDDGKVSIEEAKLKEATDFLVLDKTHTFIMNSKEVLEQTAHYLQHGKFDRLEESGN